MSIALMVQAASILFGVILCGLVFDRVNHELAFAVASLIQGLSTILAPFIGGLVPFMVAMCLQAISIGFIMAGMCGMMLTTICFEQFVNGFPTNLCVFQYQFKEAKRRDYWSTIHYLNDMIAHPKLVLPPASSHGQIFCAIS